MLEHLALNWGNWASVVGLVFSVLSFYYSKGAKQAAEDARDSVLRKTLSQDMADATEIATDILRFASMERADMATFRTSELLSHLSYCTARWEGKLSSDSHTNLRRVQEHLLVVHKELNLRPITEMSPKQKARLAEACQSVNSFLSREQGTATRVAEGGN
jgi:hypothetical protein